MLLNALIMIVLIFLRVIAVTWANVRHIKGETNAVKAGVMQQREQIKLVFIKRKISSLLLQMFHHLCRQNRALKVEIDAV